MKWNRLLALAVVLAFAAGGCKKSDNPQEAKPKPAEKVGKAAPKPTEKPAEKTAEEPVVEPAEKPAEQLVAEPDVTAEADVAAEATAEPAAEPGEKPVAEPAEKPVAEPVEKPAEEAAAEPVEDVVETPEADVVAQGDVPVGTEAEEELPETHFGPHFKLGAIMMIADVTKYPDHYSSFDSIKLRGKIISIRENMMLLGHETTDGYYVVAVDMGRHPDRKLAEGATVQMEGRLEKRDWSLDTFGAVETGGKELGKADGHVLLVVSGTTE